MNVIHKTRIFLIQIGKILPFIVCFIATISYYESIFALCFENYILYDNYAILYKPISFFIGRYFEYNLQTLVVLCVISVAIETCIYNKLACLYLGVNLFEKYYFDFELEPTTIYIICLVNILVAGYITIKGLRIISRKQ